MTNVSARIRWYAAVLCALAAGIPGCGVPYDDPPLPDGPAGAVIILITAPWWVPEVAERIGGTCEQLVLDHRLPPRQLHAIKARVTDHMGNPLQATLAVRVADRYTAAPEQLPASTYQTGADGAFEVVIGQRKAVCMDVTAAGMQPGRRWFIVLYEGVGKTWPEDQSEIVPVNAAYEMNGETAIQLAPGEPRLTAGSKPI